MCCPSAIELTVHSTPSPCHNCAQLSKTAPWTLAVVRHFPVPCGLIIAFMGRYISNPHHSRMKSNKPLLGNWATAPSSKRFSILLELFIIMVDLLALLALSHGWRGFMG